MYAIVEGDSIGRLVSSTGAGNTNQSGCTVAATSFSGTNEGLTADKLLRVYGRRDRVHWFLQLNHKPNLPAGGPPNPIPPTVATVTGLSATWVAA